jgi:hypothetical protein
MKITIIFLCTFLIALPALGGSIRNAKGVGYLAKINGTKVYSSSVRDQVDQTVNKDFSFVAFDSGSVFSGIIASESLSDGRAHVRYWKNGINADDGENTAWVNTQDMIKFRFDCCGDARCTGLKNQQFKPDTYTECFMEAVETAVEKNIKQADIPDASAEDDLEKLKIQLEIEKIKLETERLKSSTPPIGESDIIIEK